ncbi:MAG: hypothetical protein AABZ51_02310 [Nitrospirota bacterium]
MKKEYLVLVLFVLFVWSSRDKLPTEFQFWKKSSAGITVQNKSGQDITDVSLVVYSTHNSLGAIKKDTSRTLAVKRLRDYSDVVIRFKYGGDIIERYVGPIDEDSNYQMTIFVNFAGVVTAQTGSAAGGKEEESTGKSQ